MKDITTISLTKTTKNRLIKCGKFGDTYDDILNRLLENEMKSI